jgi:aminopeptidase 2
MRTNFIQYRSAMGQSPDPKLIDETLEYILTKARDQDVVYFFGGLNKNSKDHRIVVEFFKKNYDAFYKRFEGNFMLRYLVEYTFVGLSAERDYQDTVEFFKDKDTSKYSQALAQVLESIRAKIAWVDRSTGDLREWLEKWEKL